MILTFADAGVLIAAARRGTPIARRALQVLDDPVRTFASSVFVRLEVMPKATYYRRQDEIDLYHAYFNTQVQRWAEPIGEIVERALEMRKQVA